MLQIIVNEHPKPLGRTASAQDTDTLLSLQLIRADPPLRRTGSAGGRKPHVKFSFAETLASGDEGEDSGSTSTHTNTNPPPPVLRTVDQCRAMLREYLSIVNPSSIVPAFPIGTDGYAGSRDGKARAVERFYQRLLLWVPEIEQWSGFHEFFSDRSSLANQPTTQKQGLFGQWFKMINELLLKRAKPIPSLPVHYTCEEVFEFEVDTLSVYKELLVHEASIVELQKHIADRILALCEAGRASQDMAEKLEDLTSIRPIPAYLARRSTLSASIVNEGSETISPGVERDIAHDQVKFEEFSSRTTTFFADIEHKQQAFIKRITEQAIESLHEHLLDFTNAKVCLCWLFWRCLLTGGQLH